MALQWPLWRILATTADVAAAMGETSKAERAQGRARRIYEAVAERVPTAELRASFTGEPYL